MKVREAALADWEEMHRVRLAVKENILVNTQAVTLKHFADILLSGGMAWVCEQDGQIVGFSIVDIRENNIWTLFVDPAYEGKGIGKALHHHMLNQSFSQPVEFLKLSTAPGTRAEQFYLKAGWEHKGLLPNGEIHFEMRKEKWLMQKTIADTRAGMKAY